LAGEEPADGSEVVGEAPAQRRRWGGVAGAAAGALALLGLGPPHGPRRGCRCQVLRLLAVGRRVTDLAGFAARPRTGRGGGLVTLAGDQAGEQAALHGRAGHAAGEQAGDQYSAEVHRRSSITPPRLTQSDADLAGTGSGPQPVDEVGPYAGDQGRAHSDEPSATGPGDERVGGCAR